MALLFEGPYMRAHREYGNFDVSPDGRRFLMVSGKQTAHTQLHVVLDWFGELDRLARRK